MTSLLYRIVNRHTGHRIAEYSEQLISSHTGASHINTAQLRVLRVSSIKRRLGHRGSVACQAQRELVGGGAPPSRDRVALYNPART